MILNIHTIIKKPYEQLLLRLFGATLLLVTLE